MKIESIDTSSTSSSSPTDEICKRITINKKESIFNLQILYEKTNNFTNYNQNINLQTNIVIDEDWGWFCTADS